MAINRKDSILIIDDDKLNIIALTRILGSDYTVYFEGNGESGIKAAKAFKPDLIMLDVIMPGMSGFDVIKILKDDIETRDIPVIFLTGRRDVQDEEVGFVLGAVDYITKPFSVGVVKLRVQNQLKIMSHLNTIRKISTNDALTGLSNRKNFNSVLDAEWKRAARTQKLICLMVMDIDNFKEYNETYGNLSGDVVLRGVADVIKNCASRAYDHIARWGGEEFAVILPETDILAGYHVAEKIRAAVEEATFELEDGVVTSVTVSIGVHSVAVGAVSGYSLKNFVSDTDTALFDAKNLGRNKVVCVQ